MDNRIVHIIVSHKLIVYIFGVHGTAHSNSIVVDMCVIACSMYKKMFVNMGCAYE